MSSYTGVTSTSTAEAFGLDGFTATIATRAEAWSPALTSTGYATANLVIRIHSGVSSMPPPGMISGGGAGGKAIGGTVDVLPARVSDPLKAPARDPLVGVVPARAETVTGIHGDIP